MPLVQINAIREILGDVKQRLAALPPTPGPPDPAAPLAGAKAAAALCIGHVSRLEEMVAKKAADDAGVP